MPISINQLIAAARQRVGNKLESNAAEQFIPDEAIKAEMAEYVAECCRLFGASTARVETGFMTTAVPPLSVPTGLTPTPSESGGTLSAGTYSYQMSAMRNGAETLCGTAGTGSIAGSTGSIALAWASVTGATAYRIYGRMAGYPQLLATVQAPTLTWTDTGAATPGSGPPINDSTASGNAFLQDYDVQTFIGSDVMSIEEVIWSNSYHSDATLAYDLVDPYTGIPSVRGSFIDQTYQEDAFQVIQQQQRFRHNDEFSYELVNINGRLNIRLMPPPYKPIYVNVRYISTTEGLASLPESARIPLEHAACCAVLDCKLNRIEMDPPEVNQSYRDHREALDQLSKQRDRYQGRYRAALNRLLPLNG